MLVLSSAGTSRYNNCSTDGSTNSRNDGHPFVFITRFYSRNAVKHANASSWGSAITTLHVTYFPPHGSTVTQSNCYFLSVPVQCIQPDFQLFGMLCTLGAPQWPLCRVLWDLLHQKEGPALSFHPSSVLTIWRKDRWGKVGTLKRQINTESLFTSTLDGNG